MDVVVWPLAALFVLVALGLPVAFALLASAMLMFAAIGGIRMMAVTQQMVGGVDSFILLAVPLFILAAKVMNSALITDRIFHFAGTLVRHIRGGLGHVNILASLIFAGMSGSAVADAAGLGEIEIKAMRERGFSAGFAAAITAASSVVGPIFPPSVPFIIYGSLAGVSIASLFLAGALPGIVLALFMIAATYILARRRGYPSEPRAHRGEIWSAFKGAFFPILSPVIVLGAIISGVTTPTEAAAVAVLYSLCLAFAYGTLKPRDLPRLLIDTGVETGALMLIVAAVSIFTWTVTFQEVPQSIMSAIFTLTQDPTLVVLMIVGILLVLGLFMNPTPGLIVAVPFVLPIAEQLQMDLVHLGVLMVLVLAIGLITPPVGLCLFIVARIARVDMSVVARECAPYLVALMLAALIIAFVPWVTLFVPNLVLGG